MRTEDHVLEPEHFVADPQVLFDGELGYTVWIFGNRDHVLRHRDLAGTVDSNGGREDETFHRVVDGGIYEINRPDEIIGVVKPLYEVAEAFSSISRQVIDVCELTIIKKAIHQIGIRDRATNKSCTSGHIVN